MTGHVCTTGAHPDPSMSCYANHGCRCEGCRAEAVGYCRNRRRQVAYGRWRGLVEAARARALVASLRDQGASDRWIAAHAGLPKATVGYLRHGQRDRVWGSTDDALVHLAGQVASGQLQIPGQGEAVRRRQARQRRQAYRQAQREQQEPDGERWSA